MPGKIEMPDTQKATSRKLDKIPLRFDRDKLSIHPLLA